jgi:hypothetical protein
MFLHLQLLFNPGADMATPHDSYFFHGFAGNQIVGDPAFYDLSGNQADALPGTNLSNANLWTNAGYASTVDPAGGATDSVLRFPNLNFDYNGGEKLIVWWLGKVTAEGAAAEMMGDGTSTSGAGVALRVNTNATHQLVLSDGTTTTFSGSSTTAVLSGSLKALAFAIDGSARKYCLWSEETDGLIQPFTNAAALEYATLSSGEDRDTRNPNTFNIGCARPESAASTAGIAVQTRGLVILRLSPTKTMPSVTKLTQIFQALRRNPSHLIRLGAF